MKLVVVRHGHVEGITPPRFRGRTELPLTALEGRQAAASPELIGFGMEGRCGLHRVNKPGHLLNLPLDETAVSGQAEIARLPHWRARD